MPGAALIILGGVEADAKDPGPEIAHFRQARPRAPALEEGLLGGVLSVVRIAEHEQQRARARREAAN